MRSRLRMTRWDILWIVLFTVVLEFLLLGTAADRDQVLGRNERHLAEVSHVEPGTDGACASRHGEQWLVTVVWEGGQGGFARCDHDSPYQVGDQITVWVSGDSETVQTASPTDRRVLLLMVPFIAYLFIVLLPAVLLPMKTGISRRVRTWRNRQV